MKTLKKVLSLVLVVAMIASMLIVGAAATEEETLYPEAAAVVEGLGIFEGDGTGMNYKEGLTRAQAAKIITYMILGKDTAESLKVSAAPFADVKATDWHAPYVAYLKSQGIVSGVTDTEFNPNGPVTDVAFAKMLLVAVGYGANDEFEGNDWLINTITFANKEGIFAGSEAADVEDGLTREEAMLYLFNGLLVPSVNYNKTFEAYYVGNSPLQTGIIEEEWSLGYLNYGLVKVGTGVDAFGRPAAVWTAAGLPLVNTTATQLPVKSIPGTVLATDIYALLGKTVVDGINATASTYYVDGDDSFDAYYPALSATSRDYVGGQGAVTEIYVTYLGAGAYDVDIVVINEHYGKVTRVNKLDNELTVKVGAEYITVDGELVDITGLKKDDHVLFTAGTEGVATIKAITPVTGTYTANQNIFYIDYIVVDGAYYALRGVALPAQYDKAYDLYLDSQGNVVYYELNAGAVVTDFNYAYVNDFAVEVVTGDLLNTESTKVVFDVTYATGGTAVVATDILTIPGTNTKFFAYNGGYIYLKADAEETDEESIARIEAALSTGWFTYTTTESGNITLGDIAVAGDYADVAEQITVAYNASSVTTEAGTYDKVANASTVLTTIDALGTATVKTGVASFAYPSATFNSSDVLITFAKDSKVIKSITVVNVPAPDAEDVVVYCVSKGTTGYYGTNYTVAYADGTIATLLCVTDCMTAGNVYNIIDANYDNVYEAGLVEENVVNAGDFGSAYTGYEAAATIDLVEDNYFVTLELDANGDDDFEDELEADDATYYYDAYTYIVDCTGRGATTLSEGDIFVAYTADQSVYSSFYGNAAYCSIIWIVG